MSADERAAHSPRKHCIRRMHIQCTFSAHSAESLLQGLTRVNHRGGDAAVCNDTDVDYFFIYPLRCAHCGCEGGSVIEAGDGL